MYKILLILHVAVGIVALISGAVAIFSKKGAKLHLKSGKVYVAAMYSIGITALIMTIMKFNPFLLSIALFSSYLTYSGNQAIKYWRLKEAFVPTLKDKLPYYIAFLTSIFMIGFPVAEMILSKSLFVPILGIFGSIMLANSINDIRTHANNDNFKPRRKEWLIQHIGMMGGAYIATTTAFLVNNVHIDPMWIWWLLPSVIGSVFITRSIREWQKKLFKTKVV